MSWQSSVPFEARDEGTEPVKTLLVVAARVVVSSATVTVALPAMRGWPALLIDGPDEAKRATHPVLFDAMKVLRRWTWKVVGQWRVGAATGT